MVEERSDEEVAKNLNCGIPHDFIIKRKMDENKYPKEVSTLNREIEV